MKYFIVTVDTEGDNLWDYVEGETINTRNAEFIPRFQQLCQKYGFKPVYLINFEMANSQYFVNKAKEWTAQGLCEIGLHLHAWNNPPIVELEGPYHSNPYLIEYSEDVMRAKFKTLYELLLDKFGVNPVTHRAGRWAMDERYFKILKDFGIKVDCSYTPGVNWISSKGVTRGGSDYTTASNNVQWIEGVLEVPATLRRFRNCYNGTLKHKVKSLLKGEVVWLRPAISSFKAMKHVLDIVDKEADIDYVEFMIHSSELMPGGSPYFRTTDDVEREYKTMNQFFNYVALNGYQGITLADYYNTKA